MTPGVDGSDVRHGRSGANRRRADTGGRSSDDQQHKVWVVRDGRIVRGVSRSPEPR